MTIEEYRDTGSLNKEYFVYEPSRGEWDAFVTLQAHPHVLQLSGYGELKKSFGWGIKRLCLLNKASQIVGGTQILLKSVSDELLKEAYIPMGPYISGDCNWDDLWRIVNTNLSPIAKSLKWEPGIYSGEIPDFEKWGFKSTNENIQPPRTIMVNLQGTDDELLARMNQGTRRKIRQCREKGVQIYKGSFEDIDAFNALMFDTANRKEFHARDANYQKLAYEFYKEGNFVELLMARIGAKHLAGIMVFAVGDTAWYLYGASSSTDREFMASYGLQWEAIKWARGRGCKQYDLWGIPDAEPEVLETEFQKRSDGLWGVYGFKRGFGGKIIRSVGALVKTYEIPSTE